MEIKCERCGSLTRMQVQATISAPGELAHKLSKQNLRRADVYLMGVHWETADFICTNDKCRAVMAGYGNYVSNLEKENSELRAELEITRENYKRERLERLRLAQGWVDECAKNNLLRDKLKVEMEQYRKETIDEIIFYVTETLFDERTADKIDEYFNGSGK